MQRCDWPRRTEEPEVNVRRQHERLKYPFGHPANRSRTGPSCIDELHHKAEKEQEVCRG